MHSKAASGKASKGTVQIINSHERLQLRFRYAGRRHYISLGVSDTAINRKLAEMKAREIELDILSGHFDETLVKYKPHSALTTAAPDITPTITPTPSLKELWEKFVEYKRPQCSPNTMYYVYGHFTTYLEKLPTHALSEAVAIRDFALKAIHRQTQRLLRLGSQVWVD